MQSSLCLRHTTSCFRHKVRAAKGCWIFVTVCVRRVTHLKFALPGLFDGSYLCGQDIVSDRHLSL